MKKLICLSLLLVLLAGILTACISAASSTASCAFVVGSGYNGNDSKLHKVIFPGQQVIVGTDEVVSYFPCNSRNYIINDGSVKDLKGKPVGDRAQLIEATTSTGVPIKIAARALWTLNQSEDAMEAFYQVCFKYKCASEKDQSGDQNFSTDGWNGMLAENMGPAMETAAKYAAFEVDDSIWNVQDPKQIEDLQDKMSAIFDDVMRANLGYPVDLFCGSGNSAWSDPEHPGEGDFVCTPVRIIVDSVQRGDIQNGESTMGLIELNKQRLQNAVAIYGSVENAAFWLALQDSIEKCKGSGATCVFNIGFPTTYPVVLPAGDNVALPTPAPTATAQP